MRIAFVPTMGNLHAGHISLLAAARYRAHRVISSVFVNPLQFGPSEDLAAYPRTLASDSALAAAHDVDIVFAPSPAEMYPSPPAVSVTPAVARPGDVALDARWEGAVRPVSLRRNGSAESAAAGTGATTRSCTYSSKPAGRIVKG